MNTALITEKLAEVTSLRIGVIGDLMLDTYTYGRVERISPEAPVPIIQIESEMAVLGGAGNVYANLATLGVNTVMMGSVGADTLGVKLIDLLLAGTGKAVPHHVVVDRSKPTINKQRIVAGTQQLLRIDTESTATLDDALTDTLISGIPVYFAGVTAICIADYGKGFMTKRLAEAVIAFGRSNRIPVVVDTKPKNIDFYHHCTLLTPNEGELMQMTVSGTVAERAQALARATDTNVLVTRGGHGMLYADVRNDAAHFSLPSFATDVRDVSGAGDTVVAFAVVGLALGLGMEDAVTLANHAAAVSVSKPHTAVVTIPELLAKLSSAT
jgi:D-beta-D-heptose 7-phosphate kinase/D-beta-D-heptose 1-phosphate adenosyltransferase